MNLNSSWQRWLPIALIAVCAASEAVPARANARVGPASLVVEKRVALPTDVKATELAIGMNHTVWVSLMPALGQRARSNSAIAEITPTGAISVSRLPGSTLPEAIAVGADGDLWYSDSLHAMIVRRLHTGGFRSYPIPIDLSKYKDVVPPYLVSGPATFPYVPNAMAFGADKFLWITLAGCMIARLNPADGHIAVSRIVESGDPSCEPVSIVAGADGNMWFTVLDAEADESGPGRIGRIDHDGVVKLFLLPSGCGLPVSLVRGPDRSLWFADPLMARIGRVKMDGHAQDCKFSGFNREGSSYSGIGAIASASGRDLWYTLTDETLTPRSLMRLSADGKAEPVELPTTVASPDFLALDGSTRMWIHDSNSNAMYLVKIIEP